ncbi:MAG: hypothetical protein V4687_16640 [Bacteroidota bacterium]
MEFKEGGFQLKAIGESKNDLEIRYYEDFFPGGATSITIIKVKNNLISGDYFFKRNDMMQRTRPDSVRNVKNWERHPFIRFKISSVRLDTLINELFYNNLMSLKNQSEILNGRGYKINYSIAYKVNSHYGNFSFGDPKLFLKDNPDIKEFQKYDEIIRLFRNLSKQFNSTVENYDVIE